MGMQPNKANLFSAYLSRVHPWLFKVKFCLGEEERPRGSCFLPSG